MGLLEAAEKVAAEFEYTPEQVNKAVQEFLKEMDEGLKENGTTMAQIPTYVTSVPNGTEKGLFMAVDLGGTNFRVCSIRLHGNRTFSLTQSKVAIPQELQTAKTSKELFSFLAKQIEKFLATHHEEHFENTTIRRRMTMSSPEGFKDEEIFHLGFTFSFPVHQVGINRGTLIRWTKGFNIQETVGKDVCLLLQEEIDLLHLPVKVSALVNDTVGTLMARSYTSPGKGGSLIGAIFGTGTNGAYVEKLERITKLSKDGDQNFDTSTGDMIVNTEWGSFDNHLKVLPDTPYDHDLDAESVNPGFQMFEKRISGMFLGEILRRALLHLVKDPKAQLFHDPDSASNDFRSTTIIAEDSALYTQWGIDTSLLSIVQADTSRSLVVTRQALFKDLGIHAASIEDAAAVKTIVNAIGRRAARLAAVAIGSVVLNSGRLVTTHLESSTPKKPAGAIAEDIKNLNIVESAKASANKIAEEAVAALEADPENSKDAGTVEEDDSIDVGVDGSLVEFYPGFEDLMREALREIKGIGEIGEKKIRIGIAKDGSGVGAALIALVAGKMDVEKPKRAHVYAEVIDEAEDEE